MQGQKKAPPSPYGDDLLYMSLQQFMLTWEGIIHDPTTKYWLLLESSLIKQISQMEEEVAKCMATIHHKNQRAHRGTNTRGKGNRRRIGRGGVGRDTGRRLRLGMMYLNWDCFLTNIPCSKLGRYLVTFHTRKCHFLCDDFPQKINA